MKRERKKKAKVCVWVWLQWRMDLHVGKNFISITTNMTLFWIYINNVPYLDSVCMYVCVCVFAHAPIFPIVLNKRLQFTFNIIYTRNEKWVPTQVSMMTASNKVAAHRNVEMFCGGALFQLAKSFFILCHAFLRETLFSFVFSTSKHGLEER